MANPFRAQVEIEIDGVTKVLRYDLNAFAELEKELGSSVTEIFKEGKIGFHVIREMIWAGLRWNHKRLTPEDAGKMMEPSKLAYYGEKVSEAVNLALNVDEDKGDEKSNSDPLDIRESIGVG